MHAQEHDQGPAPDASKTRAASPYGLAAKTHGRSDLAEFQGILGLQETKRHAGMFNAIRRTVDQHGGDSSTLGARSLEISN